MMPREVTGLPSLSRQVLGRAPLQPASCLWGLESWFWYHSELYFYWFDCPPDRMQALERGQDTSWCSWVFIISVLTLHLLMSEQRRKWLWEIQVLFTPFPCAIKEAPCHCRVAFFFFFYVNIYGGLSLYKSNSCSWQTI